MSLPDNQEVFSQNGIVKNKYKENMTFAFKLLLLDYRNLTEFCPLLWQAEADSVSFLSAPAATAVGKILFTVP